MIVSSTIRLHRRIIGGDAAAVEDRLEALAAQEAAASENGALTKAAKIADHSDNTRK